MDSEFVKLPFEFDIERLELEVNQFKESAWLPHPGKHQGNSALPLISHKGEDNDAFTGSMQETPHMQKCEYIKQIAASFGEVFGRSRFMRLAGGSEVPIHVDGIYHWHRNVRIHIPIMTNEKVIFHCGDNRINMKAGECWLFDSWRNHKVVNHSQEARVHLVLDTKGSSRFWDLVDNSLTHYLREGEYQKPKQMKYVHGKQVSILTEKYNLTPILSPGEVDGLVTDIIKEIHEYAANDPNHASIIIKQMKGFCKDWGMLFSLYGYEEKGIPKYIELLKKNRQTLLNIPFDVQLQNRQSSKTILFSRVFSAAICPIVREDFRQSL